MPPRYMEIIRSRGPSVVGVLLGDAIAVPTHWVAGYGLISCQGKACRFHVAGVCNHPIKVLHFAPAQRCELLTPQTSAEDNAAAREYWKASMKAMREGRPAPAPPTKENRQSFYLASAACIAEITDRFIDLFTPPMRGLVYSVEKSRGKLIYRVTRPTEPVRIMGHEFDVVPILERIFGMPLFPPEVEETPGEPARVLPFRKQA